MNRTEISDRTGFDHGDKFTCEQQVREYFTLANMKLMFGVKRTPAFTQWELGQMADEVLSHRWHCAF